MDSLNGHANRPWDILIIYVVVGGSSLFRELAETMFVCMAGAARDFSERVCASRVMEYSCQVMKDALVVNVAVL
jgi:hypothetical protein